MVESMSPELLLEVFVRVICTKSTLDFEQVHLCRVDEVVSPDKGLDGAKAWPPPLSSTGAPAGDDLHPGVHTSALYGISRWIAHPLLPCHVNKCLEVNSFLLVSASCQFSFSRELW